MRRSILVTVLVLCCSAACGQQEPPQKWSNAVFRGNYQRSGVVDEQPVRNAPHVRWKITDVRGPCAPVVFDGILYTGESFWYPMYNLHKKMARVLALDMRTGARAWSFETEGVLASPPLATEERVYVTTLGGHLYALARATGEPIWQFRDPEKLSIATSPVLLDGVIYYATWEGDFRAVSAAEGVLLWSLESEAWLRRRSQGGVAGEIAVRAGDLAFVLAGHSLVIVDSEKRAVKWRGSNQASPVGPGEYVSFPSCSVGPSGLIYTSRERSILVGEQAGAATLRRLTFVTSLTTEKEGIVYRAENPIAPYICITDKRLYLATQHQRVYALDIESYPAKILWQHKGEEGWSYYSPTLARDVLYVPFKKADHSGGVLAFHAETGKKLWQFNSESVVWQPPVIEDGVVFLACGGELIALEEAPAK